MCFSSGLSTATDKLIEMAGIRPGMRVLDLACGAGSQTIQVAKRVGPNGSVVACDISATRLDHVRQNAAAASLHRPGGNITGLTYVHDMLAGKAVELLKDAAPQVSRVAILWNPDHADPEFRETQRAAGMLGMQLQSLEVRTLPDFDAAFQTAVRERVEALIVIVSRIVFVNRSLVGDFVEKNQLILVGVPSWLMEVGALLSYGPNIPELFRRASIYADKIFKAPDQPICQCSSQPLLN
jgi:ABC-type uncharacterized transport system substrate-binding protein